MEIYTSIEVLGEEFCIRVQGKYRRGYSGTRTQPPEPAEFEMSDAWSCPAHLSDGAKPEDWHQLSSDEAQTHLEIDSVYEKILEIVEEELAKDYE